MNMACISSGTEATRRDGQAMVEMVVAIVCILIVTGGLLQLILMGTANTDTLVEAAARAAARATSSAALAQTIQPIQDWDPGPDGMRQTRDDVPVRGSLVGVQQTIAGATVPHGDWSAVEDARFRAIAELHHGSLPSTTFGLVQGRATREVEVLPVARALFGLRDPAEMGNEIWMTLTGGLY